MKYLLPILTVLTLTGCVTTVNHNVTLNKETVTALKETKSENKVKIKLCKSNSFDELAKISEVDVSKFKKRNDVKGLLKAYRLNEKEILILLRGAVLDFERCANNG